jgi:hypothetical protein
MGMAMMQQSGNPNAGLITFGIWLNNVQPGGIWDYKISGKPGSESPRGTLRLPRENCTARDALHLGGPHDELPLLDNEQL